MTSAEALAKSAALKAEWEAAEALYVAVFQDKEAKRAAYEQHYHQFVLAQCVHVYPRGNRCQDFAESGYSRCAYHGSQARAWAMMDEQDRETQRRL